MSQAKKKTKCSVGIKKITKTCHTCRKEYSFPVNSKKFSDWIHHKLAPQPEIDELFVDGVSVKDTRMLISGTCSDCFGKVLGQSGV